MAELYPTLLPSRKNNKGEQRIYLAITQKSQTVYLATRLKIDNSSQFKNGRIIKHEEAEWLNRRLRKIMQSYEERIDEMRVGGMTAQQIKNALDAEDNTEVISYNKLLESVCEEIEKDGRESYAQSMRIYCGHLTAMLKRDVLFSDITPETISLFDKYLRKERGMNGGVRSCMARVKALINRAIKNGIVTYKIHPFQYYRLPADNSRDCYLSIEELKRLKSLHIDNQKHRDVRDLLLLSFYLGGMNLKDIVQINFAKQVDRNSVLTYVRSKTKDTKIGNKEVKITVQPEALVILDRMVDETGFIKTGYKFKKYEHLRSRITHVLKEIAELSGIDSNICFYSARKTFVQIGVDLDIPLYVLEYIIGHSPKEERNRPIFGYFKVMIKKSDDAIRRILNQVCTEEAPMICISQAN